MPLHLELLPYYPIATLLIDYPATLLAYNFRLKILILVYIQNNIFVRKEKSLYSSTAVTEPH